MSENGPDPGTGGSGVQGDVRSGKSSSVHSLPLVPTERLDASSPAPSIASTGPRTGHASVSASPQLGTGTPHPASIRAPWCPHCDGAGTSSRSYYIAEQVSHHPPISAYLYTNPSHHTIISGNFRPKSKFLGNSAASLMHGTSHIYFTNRPGEEYICTNPNIYVRGIFLGSMLLELGNLVSIECPLTNLIADIAFKTKGYFTGTYNSIVGKIRSTESGLVLFNLSGKWTDKIYFTPVHPSTMHYGLGQEGGPGRGPSPRPPIPWLDVTALSSVSKTVAPESESNEYESRRLWQHVSKALQARDMATATQEKSRIEERQRAILRQQAQQAAAIPDEPCDDISGDSRYFYTEDGVRWHFKKDFHYLNAKDIELIMERYAFSKTEEPCPALRYSEVTRLSPLSDTSKEEVPPSGVDMAASREETSSSSGSGSGGSGPSVPDIVIQEY